MDEAGYRLAGPIRATWAEHAQTESDQPRVVGAPDRIGRGAGVRRVDAVHARRSVHHEHDVHGRVGSLAARPFTGCCLFRRHVPAEDVEHRPEVVVDRRRAGHDDGVARVAGARDADGRADGRVAGPRRARPRVTDGRDIGEAGRPAHAADEAAEADVDVVARLAGGEVLFDVRAREALAARRVGGQHRDTGEGARVERVPEVLVRLPEEALVEDDGDGAADRCQREREQDDRLAALVAVRQEAARVADAPAGSGGRRGHRTHLYSILIFTSDDSGMRAPNSSGKIIE